MKQMMGWLRVALLAGMLALVSACGQSGDLYLPEGKATSIMVA
ncbi:MAG: lipoprotein [Methylophaga sp.]|nr:lipoprotein [Methylophaga sp.]